MKTIVFRRTLIQEQPNSGMITYQPAYISWYEPNAL